MLHITDQEVPLASDHDGVLVVTGTRVTLHSLVGMFEQGASPEEIADQFDSVELPDVYAVLTYYLRNRETVDAELAAQENRSEVAASHAAGSLSSPLRKKLLQARKPPRGGWTRRRRGFSGRGR